MLNILAPRIAALVTGGSHLLVCSFNSSQRGEDMATSPAVVEQQLYGIEAPIVHLC